MSERAAVAMAAATAVGAHLGGGPAPLVGALLVLVAVVARRPWLLCLAAALLAAELADRAHAGLDPVASGPHHGWVTLVGDPEPLDSGGVIVIVAVGGRRVEATAHGPPAWAFEDRLAGERVEVDGRLRGPGPPSPWQTQRRIVGRLDVTSVGRTAPAAPISEAANGLRRTLEAGAASLPARARSLLTGVVLGDDRHQPPELADDFRAAGLTHLLAVSGQNVAFLLVLARPLLAWLPTVPRALATIGLLGGFALLVRLEPSVLRAGAMAAIACIVAAAGRPAERLRILALAVTVLLLVDPLLVLSVGFGLSVGAAAGILLWASRIAAALPGPRPLAEALGVTLAAQAGALPLLVGVFGAVPLATVPANLLAVPAAGPLMTWGLTGGLLAGVVDGWLRAVLQLPTGALTWWLATVAGAGARLPLPALDGPEAAALTAMVALAVVVRHRPAGRSIALAGAGAVAVAATLTAPRLGDGHHVVAPGVVVDRQGADSVAVLGRGARPGDALERLRLAGARCVDAVVVERGAGLAVRRAAGALLRRCPGATGLAPAGEALPGWQPVPPGTAVTVGALVVGVDGDGTVAVRPGPALPSAGHARSPPRPPTRAPPVRRDQPRRRRRRRRRGHRRRLGATAPRGRGRCVRGRRQRRHDHAGCGRGVAGRGP